MRWGDCAAGPLCLCLRLLRRCVMEQGAGEKIVGCGRGWSVCIDDEGDGWTRPPSVTA